MTIRMSQTDYVAHSRGTGGATQDVRTHLRGVAERAARFAAKIGLAPHGELLGLLHDLGKYSDEFQTHLKSAVRVTREDVDEAQADASKVRGKTDHSTAGAQWVWRELEPRGQMASIVGQILALCLVSHHSGLIDCLTADVDGLGDDAFTRRMTKDPDRTHLHEVLAKVDDAVRMRCAELISHPNFVSAVQAAMGSIVRASPGQNDKTVVAQLQFGLLLRFLFSCLIDADRLDTADFEKPEAKSLRLEGRYVVWKDLESRLEDHLDTLGQPRPIDNIRREISDRCRDAASEEKGIYTLTVPTGGGKTLSSLRFALRHAHAHGMDRVIYFIPFTSIIDQNAKEVRAILELQDTTPGSVVLEHHCNLVPERQTELGQVLTENWDAPIVFTTNVQFLEAAFGGGTRGARKMHQLANAVLIFDEIQTLPINCIHLFNNAINFLVEQCGSTVVLCTATQPLLGGVDPEKGAVRIPAGHEIAPNVRRLFDDLKRVEVSNRRRAGGWSNEEIVELALEETERCGSCLVVVNTKEMAGALHRAAAGRIDAEQCYLTTNLCPVHRRKVLDHIVRCLSPKAPKPILCFSTQLIEAGVDVDFGAVIRLAAGLDSVAQAAGRCNRHGLRTTGRVHVVNPRDEHLDRLQEIRVGRDAADRVMDDFEANRERFGESLIGPEAMEWYYRNYFFARAAVMDYPIAASALGHDDSGLNLLSLNSIAVTAHGRRVGSAPNFYFRQSFMAAGRAFRAIDAPTRGLVVPYQDGGKGLVAALAAAPLLTEGWALLRQAQQYSVNVFPNVIERLGDAVYEVQKGTGILCLDGRYYSSDFGLSETPVNDMEVLHAGTELR